MFVDSHCHLTFPELMADLPHIEAAMRTAKVSAALCISTTLEEFPEVLKLAQSRPHYWASVGVHPDNEGVQEPTLHDLVDRAQDPKVIAIGETGLDYYRLNGRSHADMAWQRERFRVHIQAAQQSQKPLIIHTREASADTLAILREHSHTDAPALTGVFHCFTETQAVAEAALDLGFYISLSGIVTFKNAKELKALAQWLPLDRLLIETDSPYLAPAPYRGKINNPSYVAKVAEHIAELRGVSTEEIAENSRYNFEALFKVHVPALESVT